MVRLLVDLRRALARGGRLVAYPFRSTLSRRTSVACRRVEDTATARPPSNCISLPRTWPTSTSRSTVRDSSAAIEQQPFGEIENAQCAFSASAQQQGKLPDRPALSCPLCQGKGTDAVNASCILATVALSALPVHAAGGVPVVPVPGQRKYSGFRVSLQMGWAASSAARPA